MQFGQVMSDVKSAFVAALANGPLTSESFTAALTSVLGMNETANGTTHDEASADNNVDVSEQVVDDRVLDDEYDVVDESSAMLTVTTSASTPPAHASDRHRDNDNDHSDGDGGNQETSENEIDTPESP